MTNLNSAYGLGGPEDCARLYADWAASYDAAFAHRMDYRLPAHVAAAFLAHGGTGPVLDVGAGTGLLAECLVSQGFVGGIDGVDLSSEMLAKAAQKGLYRALYPADITRPVVLTDLYRGIVSSGTFTHGHVGPDALEHLEALAAPGAVFALSINAGVFVTQGFDRALSRRPGVTLVEVQIYGPAARDADPGHALDIGLIAVWRHPEA